MTPIWNVRPDLSKAAKDVPLVPIEDATMGHELHSCLHSMRVNDCIGCWEGEALRTGVLLTQARTLLREVVAKQQWSGTTSRKASGGKWHQCPVCEGYEPCHENRHDDRRDHRPACLYQRILDAVEGCP